MDGNQNVLYIYIKEKYYRFEARSKKTEKKIKIYILIFPVLLYKMTF